MSEEAPNPAAACPEWERLARAAVQSTAAADARDERRQLLVFELCDTRYAVPVDRVREIVRLRPITPLPRVSAEIRGVISLRGEIVQVIDVRRRLGMPGAEPTRSSRILLVVDDQGSAAGLLVDAVTQVLRVTGESFRDPVPSDSSAVEALCRSGDRFVSVIDLERVLDVRAVD